MIAVEICVESAAGLRAAGAAGADRVEICAALDVGGLTPSPGLMRLAADSGVAARALIRPRAGGFVYDEDQLSLIEADIASARDFGLSGVVIGAATAGGRLDRERLDRLSGLCGDLGRTLHRVFDLTPDPFESLETAIDLGFDRILTSGQAPTAREGAALLARLVGAASGRIVILAAGGIDADTLPDLARRTGVTEAHASCREPAGSGSRRDADPLGFGQRPRRADPERIRRLVAAARSLERRPDSTG